MPQKRVKPANETGLGMVPEQVQEAVEIREAMEAEERDGEKKTDAIRLLWLEKPELTPTQVQQELARRGVQVSRPTIYKVKQELRRAAAVTQPPSLENLLDLKRLAENFGGIERLKLMIEMLEELQL